MPADSDFNLNLTGVRWEQVCREESRVKDLVLMGYLTSEPGNHMVGLGEPALFVFTGDAFILSRLSQRN